MIIAVNTRVWFPHRLEGYGYYIQEIFSRLVKAHPEHQFYYLFDRPYDPSFVFEPNVTPMVIPPQARHPLLWKIWFDVQVPRVLRKLKADLFVSPDGYLSLTTSVAQCMVEHDLGFLHQPAAYKRSHNWYLKRYTPKFLKKADRIVTVSQYSKADMLKQYPSLREEKIDVVYNAVKPIFRPMDYEEGGSVLEQYTDGAAYFLYAGALQPRKNLVNLLKAFSIFKKRQQSNMKLVLAGRMAWKNDEFLKLLSSYKYRNDVILTGYVEEGELARLMAAAYALVYPSLFEGFGVPVLEAMQSGVPAVSSSGSAMEEVAGGAGIYFDPRNVEDIADKLMLIYKDENLRSRSIREGLQRAAEFSWDRSAAQFWDSMMKAVEEHKRQKT